MAAIDVGENPVLVLKATKGRLLRHGGSAGASGGKGLGERSSKGAHTEVTIREIKGGHLSHGRGNATAEGEKERTSADSRQEMSKVHRTPRLR